jgi:hypothetical protein
VQRARDQRDPPKNVTTKIRLPMKTDFQRGGAYARVIFN